ncbi:protein phosphatase 2C domain-containing protein [Thermophilibacter provencensis]|uniref:Protein phosphatase 2C domain-containing protein n=1 Tax=Thermophilibacter provencensis TaxID=1852386 RepID=A0ABT7V3H1_9ACTN|nr:protein phosphatase 2C domain-containing protein [Thermophilibacter provencensis]MDM8271147.1 protein phosphatase 2C domain-containing protein [Thermophilibacter provencensis]
MSRFYLSERGNAANEDFAYAAVLPGGSYGLVIDGATGLVDLPLVSGGYATNAQWFSHTVGGRVCRLLELGRAPGEALAAAVEAARAELEAALGCEVESLEAAAVPSATLALAVRRGRELELWGLADSPLVVLMRSGELVVSTDEVLESLDDAAVALMVERSAGCGLSAVEKRALVRDEVIANRQMRNVEGGYWCLDPTGEGLSHARRLTLPASDVAAVAGMSDGFFRAFGQYGMAGLGEWMAGATYFSALSLCDRMRVLEAADAALERFPRMKVGDDASIFWMGE